MTLSENAKVAASCFASSKIISKCGDLKLQVGEGSPQLGGSPQAGSAHLFFKGNS